MIAAALLGMLLGATAQARLPAGTVLSAEHLAGCASPCALVGRQLSRTVFEGRAVTLADTQAADLVARNTRVALVFRQGGLRLEAKGRSLGAAPLGGSVDVMNEESRRVVTGTVVAQGVVEVGS